MAHGTHGPIAPQLGDAEVLLVFDGHCGVCARFADWVARRDRAGRVRLLPSQAPGLIEALGLTRAEVDREAWAFDRAGRAFAGAAAVNRTLRALGGLPGILGRAYALPGLRWCEDAGYHWFSRHRGAFHRWGAVPACDRPGVTCVEESPPAAPGT
jgi:predicted DCC family thiol-disulfide oxidoreductase YuxK